MKKLTRSRPTWPVWGSAISITVRPMEMSKWPASSNRVQGGRAASTGSSLVGVRHCSADRPRKACSTWPSSASRTRTVSSWAPISCSFRSRRPPPPPRWMLSCIASPGQRGGLGFHRRRHRRVMPPPAAARSVGSMTVRYQLRVEGVLDAAWSAWFDGMEVAGDERGRQTTITGPVADQAALHGLLAKVFDLGLPLISVRRLPPRVTQPAAASPEQPQLPGAGHGLGAVGRAELAEDVADVLLDRVQGHHQLPGDLPVGPAGGEQPEHL